MDGIGCDRWHHRRHLRRYALDADRLLAMAVRQHSVRGARIELGTKAEDRVLAGLPRPNWSEGFRTDRLRSSDDVSSWLSSGGSGLIIAWSIKWPSRFPSPGYGIVYIDLEPHEIHRFDLAPFPLRPGPHHLMMPNGRTYPGRTVGELVVEPGVIASIEYCFRFPDGYFRAETLGAQSGPWIKGD